MTHDEILANATPRPWRVGRSKSFHRWDYIEVTARLSDQITVDLATATTQTTDDAELIVLAVNSYEEREALIAQLVAALANARRYIAAPLSQERDSHFEYAAMSDQIDAALAAAKKREQGVKLCHDPRHGTPCPLPCAACEAECNDTYYVLFDRYAP